MSPGMSTIVFALSILVVDICHFHTTESLTCDQLPRLKEHNTEVLVANGPFVTDFTLASHYECSVRLHTHPAHGTTDYHGTVFQIKGSEVTSYDYYFDSDTREVKITKCDTGEEFSGYVLAAEFDKNGSFFCTYRCNNTMLKGFSCASNNNGASPGEIEAVNMAKKVPNGDQIYDAREKCSPSKGCKIF